MLLFTHFKLQILIVEYTYYYFLSGMSLPRNINENSSFCQVQGPKDLLAKMTKLTKYFAWKYLPFSDFAKRSKSLSLTQDSNLKWISQFYRKFMPKTVFRIWLCHPVLAGKKQTWNPYTIWQMWNNYGFHRVFIHK